MLTVCGPGLLLASILAARANADAPAAAAPDTGLTEIVVTAEKVKSTIQETPISLTAVSSGQLEAQGITSVEEIARDVPGLSMRSAGPGLTEYDARGLASNGGAAPTVGFYRYLYGAVGQDYCWWLRRMASDAELEEIQNKLALAVDSALSGA